MYVLIKAAFVFRVPISELGIIRTYTYSAGGVRHPSIIVCRLRLLSVVIDTAVCMPRTIWVQRVNYILLAAFVVCDDKNKLT
jgi:hypothetical protein